MALAPGFAQQQHRILFQLPKPCFLFSASSVMAQVVFRPPGGNSWRELNWPVRGMQQQQQR